MSWTFAQLEHVIDNLPIGISILDREFRIERVDAAFSRLLGSHRLKTELSLRSATNAAGRLDQERKQWTPSGC